MKPQTKLHLTIATSLGLGVLLVAPLVQAPRAMAQLRQPTNPIQDLQGNNPSDLSNIFNGNSGSGGATSIMNLMNRLQLMDGRSFEEVFQDQVEGLNSAAAAFRKQQQQNLQTNPGANSSQPIQRQ